MKSWEELNFRTNLIETSLALFKQYKEVGEIVNLTCEHCHLTYNNEDGLFVEANKGTIVVKDYRYDAVQLSSEIKSVGDIPSFWLESLVKGD